MTAEPFDALQAPSAIDALCRNWMEMEPGDAANALSRLLLQAGQAPSDPAERALFWMLSGQFERYQELDLDGTLLAQAQTAASPRLRQRLAAVAADAGRMEWLRAMQHSKPLDQFSADDWTSTVRLLQRAGDPVALWQWALQAPPVHGRELLQALLAITPLPPQLVQVEPLLQRLARQLPDMTASWLKLPYHCVHTIKEDAAFMSWSADGRCLASVSSHGTIRLWDPGSGSCTDNIKGPRVHALAWSPDGHWLASGNEDKTIWLWNANSGTCAHILAGHTTRVLAIAWSPDGRCLASSGYDEKIEWWNPDHDPTIRLWDLNSGTCTHILAGHTKDIQSIAWSPDGLCLASSSFGDKTIRLWDPSTGSCIRTIEEYAQSIAWSPDGRCLASRSDDKTIRLWVIGLADLLNTPLACYGAEHWSLLAARQQQSVKPEGWQPWLDLISTLGTVIRRFDVSVDAASQPVSSPFEIAIDD